MSLSKQTFDVVSFYNECLASSPILTKALTSGIIGFTGAYVSSKIRVFIPTCNLCYKQQYNNAFIFLQNSKIENLWRSTGPLTIYSALFAAPITHYFYNILQRFFGPNLVAKVLVDRLVFCPIFVFFTLYIIDRLQVCYCNILALRRCCTGTAKHRTAHMRSYCTDNPSAARSR